MGYTCFTGFGSNVQIAWPMLTIQQTMQMLINDRSMCMVAIPSIYQIIRHCTITKSTSLSPLHPTHREMKTPSPSNISPTPHNPTPIHQTTTHIHHPPTGRTSSPPLPSPSHTHPRTALNHPCSIPITRLFTPHIPPTPAQRPDPLRSATCYLLPACLKPVALLVSLASGCGSTVPHRSRMRMHALCAGR